MFSMLFMGVWILWLILVRNLVLVCNFVVCVVLLVCCCRLSCWISCWCLVSEMFRISLVRVVKLNMLSIS